MTNQIDSSIPTLTEIFVPPSANTTDKKPASASVAAEPITPPSHPNVPVTPSVIPTTPVTAPAITPIAMPKSMAPISRSEAPATQIPSWLLLTPTTAEVTTSENIIGVKVAENNAISAAKMSVEEWQILELTLRDNVLHQVLTRIDFVLEHRMRDGIADVLHTAVDNLANEIRSGLRTSLEDVITRAVTQEIAKIKVPR